MKASEPIVMTSASGRVYTIGPPECRERFPDDPLRCEDFPVTLDGEPVGVMFRSMAYSDKGPPRWHASLAAVRRQLMPWGSKAPRGVGYDVAAFDTMAECFAAVSEGVERVINWHAGMESRGKVGG